MLSKFAQFLKRNKTRIDLIKSSFSLLLSCAMIVLLILLAVRLANGTRKIIHAADNGIASLHQTLTTVNDGLESITDSFDTLKASLHTIDDYLHGIEPILESMTKFVGTDLTKIAQDGHNSLKAAAQGSKLLDDALTFFSRLPMINFNYAPKKTLNESLLELSETFASIPDSLTGLEEGLSNSASNISSFEDKFVDFHTNIDDIKTNVKDTGSSLESFITQLESYKQNLSEIQREIITWISIITSILCLLIIIWAVKQVYIFILALEAIKSDRIAMRKRPDA